MLSYDGYAEIGFAPLLVRRKVRTGEDHVHKKEDYIRVRCLIVAYDFLYVHKEIAGELILFLRIESDVRPDVHQTYAFHRNPAGNELLIKQPGILYQAEVVAGSPDQRAGPLIIMIGRPVKDVTLFLQEFRQTDEVIVFNASTKQGETYAVFQKKRTPVQTKPNDRE